MNKRGTSPLKLPYITYYLKIKNFFMCIPRQIDQPANQETQKKKYIKFNGPSDF